MTSLEIKALRDRAGISQTELASLLGVTSSTVYRWEGDASRPSDWQVAMLDAFAEAERVQPGALRWATKALYNQGYARALYLILAVAYGADPEIR